LHQKRHSGKKEIAMSEQPDPQRIQILIVEDDPMMRTGLKHFLCAQPQLEIVGMAEDGYLGVEAATTSGGDNRLKRLAELSFYPPESSKKSAY
jgi:hypothetical protein